jgi:diguanylate cyclase (GGDEF)-like protein
MGSLRTFFCRDEDERAWLVEMNRRMAPNVARGFAAFGVFGLLALPWLHWTTFLLLGLSGVGFELANRRVQARGRIEPVVLAWFFSQAMFAAIVVVNDGVTTGQLALLLIGVVAASGGFPSRVMAVCTGYTAVLMVAAAATDAAAVIDDPVLLLMPLGALFCSAVIAAAVRTASIENRQAAVLDGLTGMLNRNALDGRVSELAHQSSQTGAPVAAIVLDIDHFKRVNDRFGHVRGDEVLREIAARVRGELRVYDLAYRLGGEEFLVLVPGAGAVEAHELAERLLEAVRSEPVAEIDVRVSAGVAASPPGEPFEWTSVYRLADDALYEAKRSGRDRVVVAGEQVLPLPATVSSRRV